MRQLVLELHPDAPPRLDNFIVGENIELLATLEQTVIGADHLYLWGPPGSGRTHLLRAAVAACTDAGRPAIYVAGGQLGAAMPADKDALVAVDDIEALTPSAEIALFNAFNRARMLNQTLLLAGTHAPLELDRREDLRTRIGQCLVFELRPLDDRTRTDILVTLAGRRGLHLGDEVIDFLLRHGRRDIPSLVTALDALDRASLERKRPVTLPLLRELMQGGLDI